MPQHDWFAQFEASKMGFTPAPASSTAVAPPWERAEREYRPATMADLAAYGVNLLPPAMALGGAGLGSLTGPFAPAAVPTLAGVGGVAGQWLRYALAPRAGMNVPQPTLEDARNELILNLVLGGGGMGLRAASRPIAEQAMRTGLRMPPTWREQWLATVRGGETPERAALRMRVGGATRAGEVESRAAAATSRRIAALTQRGRLFTAEDLAEGVLRQAERKAGRALTAPERRRIVRRTAQTADELLNSSAMGVRVRRIPPGVAPEDVPFTPQQVYDLKQTAQTLSRTRFAQQAAGVNLTATPDEIMVLSRSARRSLEQLPGVGASTLETMKARGLKRALSRAEAVQRTSLPQLGAGALGGGVAALAGGAPALPIGAFAGHALASPEAQRAVALALMNPLVQQALLYGPLAASLGVQALAPPPMKQELLPPNPAWGLAP